jgi:predicted flap endonuclease-1-like 5' DNA nuclease
MLSSSSTQSVGPGTIKRLEEAGLHTFADVAALDVEAMADLGVQRRYAKQIRAYVRRRLR